MPPRRTRSRPSRDGQHGSPHRVSRDHALPAVPVTNLIRGRAGPLNGVTCRSNRRAWAAAREWWRQEDRRAATMDASIPAAPDALLGGRLPWGAVPSTTQAEADPVVELAMDDELQSGR